MSEPDLARNLETLDGYLARFRDTGIRNRIAGADRDGGGGVFQTTSPVDESLICNVAHGFIALLIFHWVSLFCKPAQ